LASDKQDEILDKTEARSDFGLGQPNRNATTQERSAKLGAQCLL